MSSGETSTRKLRIAISGCAHGEMDKIYATMQELEKRTGEKFDLLISCGDYQSVRNYGDLHHMHVNEKYRSLQTFYKYYSGEKVAPVLTIFIGGNHEASGFLAELPNGGWVAPRIYYMGLLGVVRFGGLRIGGISGIYGNKSSDFHMGHFERPPFAQNGSIVSAYHVRSLEMFRAKQLEGEIPLDILLTHDWPGGITEFGDEKDLFRRKRFLVEDIQSGKLGNPSAHELIRKLRPRYWFAAHMHVAFAALVSHEKRPYDKEQPPPTRFLSLDKPLPGRQFLQTLEIEVTADAPARLSYDPHFLAVLKSTDHLTNASQSRTYLPSAHSLNERWDFRPTDEELAAIQNLGDLTISEDFKMTAAPLLQDNPAAKKAPCTPYYRNPQSSRFCQWLGICDLNKLLCELETASLGTPYYLRQPEEGSGVVQQNTQEFGDADFVIDSGESVIQGSFLDSFEAPKFVSKSTTPSGEKTSSQAGETIVLKKRKVEDLEEDDD